MENWEMQECGGKVFWGADGIFTRQSWQDDGGQVGQGAMDEAELCFFGKMMGGIRPSQ